MEWVFLKHTLVGLVEMLPTAITEQVKVSVRKVMKISKCKTPDSCAYFYTVVFYIFKTWLFLGFCFCSKDL